MSDQLLQRVFEAQESEAGYLTRKQVAQIFEVSVSTISNWLKNEDFCKPIVIGHRYRWAKEDLINYVANLSKDDTTK